MHPTWHILKHLTNIIVILLYMGVRFLCPSVNSFPDNIIDLHDELWFFKQIYMHTDYVLCEIEGHSILFHIFCFVDDITTTAEGQDSYHLVKKAGKYK